MASNLPGPKTPWQIAKISFRRDETEDDLRARCEREGGDPEEAVIQFRRLHASKRIPTESGIQEGFLEDRFVRDHSEKKKYGGQGSVVFGYEGTADSRRGRPVATKDIRLPPGLPSGRMPIEVEAVNTLDRSRSKYLHNLVEYLASGYWNKAHQSIHVITVVMPRADLTLRDFLTVDGPLNPETACRLILILSRVVHELHMAPPHGVLHRDLKPENILLYRVDRKGDGTPDDPDTLWLVDGVAYRPVVADLGLAKWIVAAQGNVSLTAPERGTANYMAPEQFRGGELTAQADIYALGVLLVECLTGKVPIDFEKSLSGKLPPAKNKTDQLTRLMRDAPLPLCKLGGRTMDPRLDRIARKCQRKDPAKRYSAAGLAADLARFLDPHDQDVDAPVLSRRLDEEDLEYGDKLLGHVSKWRQRWKSIAAAFLVLALLSVVIGYRQYEQRQRQQEVQRVSSVIQAALDQEPSWWTDARVRETLPYVLDLDSLDAKQAATDRQKLNDRFMVIVKQRLEVSNLTPAEITELQGLIHAYGDCDDQIAATLAASLNDRIHRWNEAFHVSAGDVPEDVFHPSCLIAKGNVLLREASAEPVMPPINDATVFGGSVLLSKRSCEGNVRLEATFDPSWARADRLALYLNAQQGHTNRISSVAVSPDGKLLATANGFTAGQAGELIVWNRENGVQLTRSQKTETRLGQRLVGFSPVRDLLAVVTQENDSAVSSVELIDTADLLGTGTMKTIARLEQKGEARCMAFSPDGEILAVGVGPWGRPGQIRLWDLYTKRERKPIPGHERAIQCMAFSPDGKTLASGGWDAKVRLRDVASGAERAVLIGHKSRVVAMAFSPDGKTLATGGPDGVRLWDAATGNEQPSRPLLAETFALAFSPDGKTLGLSNGTLVLLDCETWKPRPISGKPVGCSVLAFAADDDTLFAGGFDGAVREWSYASGTQRSSLCDQGYSFLFSSTPPLANGSKPTPSRSFQDAPTGGEFFLQILRNGVALRAPERVEAAKLSQGPLHLTAQREGDKLTFQINGLASMIVQDTFPLAGASPGVFGLDLPAEVGLQTLFASRQDLPVVPSNFESGDHDYTRGRYQQALEEYQKLSQRKYDPGEIQQARYKEALCQLGLGRREAAEELLKGVSRDEGSRWSALASGQLWLHYLETQQPGRADEVFRRLASNPPEFERLVKSLPAGGRDQLLANLRQKTWGINLFQVNPELLPNLKRLDGVLEQLHAEPADRVPTRIALLRAYWLDGKTDEACQVAQAILQDADLLPVNRIMVLEEYCWILRQTGKSQEALNRLNNTLVETSGAYRKGFVPLFLERARLHAALGELKKAESDLRTLLERVPEQRLAYRYQSGAYLMLGFLHDQPGEHAAALEAWRLGFRSPGQRDFPSYTRSGADFGSLGLFQGLILGSLTGDLSDSEAQAVVGQVLANGLDVSSLVDGPRRLLPSLISFRMIPPEILREMWTSARARENARKLAFQDLALTDYLRTILATASAAVLRHEVAGEPSDDQEAILWTLADATASAYTSGKIDKNLVFQLGLAWRIGDASRWEDALKKLKTAGFDGTLCDPLDYFFGHRLLRLHRLPDAKRVFTAVRDRARNDPCLSRLAEQEVDRLK